MHEKDIVTAILSHLKTVPYCFAWKTHGGMYDKAGIPDIIACIFGMFMVFEVKTPSGKLTKLQESTLKKIKAARGAAFKVTSVDEVKDIIFKFFGETNVPYIRCADCMFVRPDHTVDEDDWTAYECGNEKSPYHKSLVNISLDGDMLPVIAWSGCVKGVPDKGKPTI